MYMYLMTIQFIDRKTRIITKILVSIKVCNDLKYIYNNLKLHLRELFSIIRMVLLCLDSPSSLTLLQQQQREKYGNRNFDGGGHHNDMNNINGGIDGYGAFNYDDNSNTNENHKHSNRRNKNFWRIEYNFTSLYRMPEISAQTLDRLSHRLQTIE